MDLSRLFKVLVIGGAALGCSDDSSPADASNGAVDAPATDAPSATDAPVADTNVQADSTPANDVPAVDGATLCFCPADCCEEGEAKSGIECCWSTSC